MRGQVLASLPADHGKRIRYSHSAVLAVEAEVCGCCGLREASVVVQGETDSFGFEPVFLCAECHAQQDAQQEQWNAAVDLEDRAPREGYVFLVSECTNYDGHGSWCRTFRSFREATAYYRRIEAKAEPYGGLYPDHGVREVAEAEGRKAVDAERRAVEDEWRAIEQWRAETEAATG